MTKLSMPTLSARSLAATAAAVTLTAALAAPAYAQTAQEANRDANQQARIQQGVNSGQLTAHETAKLERGEARIDRAEARAGADGVVTGREQAHINAMQNRESAKIYNQKHDAQTQ